MGSAPGEEARWAAERAATIPRGGNKTTGLFYDSDGIQHTYVSGEDDDATHAAKVLAEVGAPPSRIGTYPAATHVEIKAAGRHVVGRMVAWSGRHEVAAVHGRRGMTLAAPQPRAWAEFGVDKHGWMVSGEFQLGTGSYHGEFRGADELGRFVDFLLAAPVKPATSRLYLHPAVVPARPADQLSNLRFQFDTQHQVGAAVLLVADRDDHVFAWMTHGDAGREDVMLAHDSWNAEETLFPPESFITLPQLRAAVVEWAFGDVVPPTAVRWSAVSGVDWF